MLVIIGLILVIGLLIVVARSVGAPPAPPGMRTVACPRCNAIQNVGTTERDCVCWRCGGLTVFTDRFALDVECPVCAAAAGYECRRRGRAMQFFHRSRCDLAREVQS